MVKQFNTLIKTTCLISFVGLAVCCSGSSDDKNTPPTDDDKPIAEVDSTQTIDSTETGNPIDMYSPTVFTVIGDVPYSDAERSGLIALIETHNGKAKSEFVVHVGDIKPGSEPCEESIYQDVSGLLKDFQTPTFIVLGDNEFNDCGNPAEAFGLWNKYFLHFNENWEFPYTVEYQEERPENFGWIENGVLFLGLNLVGSQVQDQGEWDKRLADDADWVEEQFELQKENFEAAVLFGHANMVEIGPEKFKPFTDRFRAASKNFAKPVLLMQGDGHFWFKNRPWPEANILRVQVEAGANAVQVTVDPDLNDPFVFDREFLD